MGHIVKGTPAIAPVAAPVATTSNEEAVALLVAARADAKAAAIVLARKMAERIVGHAVAVDPAVMRQIAAHALAALKTGNDAVVLRVHPEDLAALEPSRTTWLTEIEVEADVRVVTDESVGRYGCIVETAGGRVDARLRTQLDALERVLRDVGG